MSSPFTFANQQLLQMQGLATALPPEDDADDGEWTPPRPQPALYGQGFPQIRQPQKPLLDRLGDTAGRIGHGALEFGKQFLEDLDFPDFLNKGISNRERVYRALNVGSFFLPPLKIGQTAAMATRMAIKAAETGAVTGALSAVRGDPIVPSAILGGGLGAGVEALLTKGRRMRVGTASAAARNAFRDPAAFNKLATSPIGSQEWAVLSGQLTDGTKLKLPDAKNLELHQQLGEEIRNLGYEPMEARGYGPNQNPDPDIYENAWLVPGMKRKHALELANAYQQGSVLTHEGLFSLDTNEIFPIKKSRTKFRSVNVGHDYYTDVPGLGQFGLEFDNPIAINAKAPKSIGPVADAHQRLESLVYREDDQPLMDKVINMPIRSTLKSWYIKLVRSFEGLADFEKAAKSEGQRQDVLTSASKLAQLAAGHSSYAQHAFEYGIPNWDDRTEIVAPALESILSKVKPGEWKRFEDYGFARRFLHLSTDRGFSLPKLPGGSRLTIDDLTKIIADTEEAAPHLKQIFEDTVSWRNSLLNELLVKPKILSEDAYKAITSTSLDFVPLRIAAETALEKTRFDMPGDRVIFRNPIERITGIASKKFEPWTHALIRDLYSWSKLAHNQQVALTFINDLEGIDKSLSKRFAEKIRTPPLELTSMQAAAVEEIKASDPELAKHAEATGLEFLALMAPSKLLQHGYIGALLPQKEQWMEYKPKNRPVISVDREPGSALIESTDVTALDKNRRPVAPVPKPAPSTRLSMEEFEAMRAKFSPEMAGPESLQVPPNSPGTELVRAGDTEPRAWTHFDPDDFEMQEKEAIQRVWYKITDPNIWEAFQAMKPAELGLFTKVFAGVASTLRAGATLALEFMARNPLKDVLHAGVVTGTMPQEVASGFAHAMRKDDVYQRYLAAGGGRAGLVAQDRAAIRTHIANAIGMNERSGIGKFYNVVRSPIEALQAMSDFFETGTRVGVFDQKYQEYLKNGIAAPEAVRRAALDSRNATVDFGVHGSKTTAVRLITAFWNAQIQGYDNLVRSFAKDPMGTSARATAMITVPSVLLYFANRDDDEYFQLPQWERDMFWHVKMPESLPWVHDKWMRFPKPFDLGYQFGSSVERFLQFLDNDDKKAVDSLAANYLTKNFGDLVPLPTAFRPIAENAINKSFLRNRPIESRGMADIAPEYRIQPGTSDFAAKLGGWLGYSPIKIDNLIRGYLGGLGRVGTDLGDAAVNLNSGRPLLPTEGGFFDPRDIPGLRGLFSQFPRQTESVDKLYEIADQMREAEYTRAHLRQTMQLDDLGDWIEHKALMLGMKKPVDRLLSQVKVLREMRDMILRDRTMSSNERAEQLDSISRAMMGLAQMSQPMSKILEEEK